MADSPHPLIALTLAGVPEQVNTPINICLERGIFLKHGVDITFRLVPEGTGAMLNLLETGEVDLALTVTDAFMVGKANGRRVQLLGTFVESPLVWAVATAASIERENISTIADLLSDENLGDRMCKFGISRMGSGSATMAHYMCSLHGKKADSSSFVIANNFDGLKAGVQGGLFDAFLWETFTTKPWFDKGELKKVGEVPTPWSAFSFVSGLDMSESKSNGVLRLFAALAEGCEIFKNEGASVAEGTESSVQRICREFGHTADDAALWLSRCRYAISERSSSIETTLAAPMAVDLGATNKSVLTLIEVGLIPQGFQVESLWSGNQVIKLKNT